MLDHLEEIFRRPEPWERYTAADLWADPHISERMLAFHLDPEGAVASRPAAFIDRSVDWIVSRFGLGPGSSVADFGCGPGLYANRLARRGIDVTGIDFSQRSIDYARGAAEAEGLDVTYTCRNYLEFYTENRFDLVLLIMCDFCALSPVQRRSLLETFHSILHPEGHVVLDVYSVEAFEKRAEESRAEPNLMDGFWSAEPYLGFLNAFVYEQEKVVLDRYTIVEEGSVRTIYNWLQYFSPASLEQELAAAGFSVSAWHADVAGRAFDPAADEFAVVAKRV